MTEERHHNLPVIDAETIVALAETSAEQFSDPLKARAAEIADAADEWKKATITDENEVAANDFKVQVIALEKDIEDGHKTAKQPYWDGGKKIDAAKKDLLELVAPSKTIIIGKLNDLLARRDAEQREAERKARAAADEAERKAKELAKAAEQDNSAGVAADAAAKRAAEEAEEKKRQAAAAAKARPQTRGSSGRATGYRTSVQIKITDLNRAVRCVLDDQAVLDAVAAALRRKAQANQAAINKGIDPPHVLLGVEIGETRKAA